MPLYEGLNREGSAADPAARRVVPAPASAPASAVRIARQEGRPDWRELNARTAGAGARAGRGGSFLDSFLGAGSSDSLKQAFTRPAPAPPRGAARPPRAEAPPARAAAPARPARVAVVGSGEEALPLVRGRKGVGRAVLVLLAMATAVAALRPWQREGNLKADWSALLKVPQAHGGPDLAEQARLQDAKDAAALAALPLRPAEGPPVALWRDSTGRWWRVVGDGALAPCADPQGADNLGLPELRGVAAGAEAYGGGRRERLKLPPGRLARLLPLETSVASEVAVLDLSDPAEPVLFTLDGTRCLMGDGDWSVAQRRLALVLADLAARRRRAALVDLRFEDTAVVRPL